MPPDEQQAIWDAQIVPDSGRPFFQSGFAMLDRSSPTRVDFANPDRAPLLFVSGDADRAMPPAVVRRMFRAHQASPVRTDFCSFPGRTHWLIGQDGWEEIAQACIDWIESLVVESSRGRRHDRSHNQFAERVRQRHLARP
jgi:pimeloyl-ACP methyl ester carboxylesterase